MKMETCQNCGRVLPVEGSVTPEGVELEFRGFSYYKVHQVHDTVAFTADPFQEEINADDTELWICESCWYESAMDV